MRDGEGFYCVKITPLSRVAAPALPMGEPFLFLIRMTLPTQFVSSLLRRICTKWIEGQYTVRFFFASANLHEMDRVALHSSFLLCFGEFAGSGESGTTQFVSSLLRQICTKWREGQYTVRFFFAYFLLFAKKKVG